MIPRTTGIMAAYKIKFSTVLSRELTESDFTIGFNVVDLAGNKVYFIDLYRPMRFPASSWLLKYPTLFSAKSTTLNPMVKSYLVN